MELLSAFNELIFVKQDSAGHRVRATEVFLLFFSSLIYGLLEFLCFIPDLGNTMLTCKSNCHPHLNSNNKNNKAFRNDCALKLGSKYITIVFFALINNGFIAGVPNPWFINCLKIYANIHLCIF